MYEHQFGEFESGKKHCFVALQWIHGSTRSTWDEQHIPDWVCLQLPFCQAKMVTQSDIYPFKK